MKPFRVVCTKGHWALVRDFKYTGLLPVKGEIYAPLAIITEKGIDYYVIEINGVKAGYKTDGFREADDTFGTVVCERIEQQIQYEKVLVNN